MIEYIGFMHLLCAYTLGACCRCVKHLLDHEVLAVAVDNDDHTPGDLATAAGYTEIAAYIKTYLDEVKEREKQVHHSIQRI